VRVAVFTGSADGPQQHRIAAAGFARALAEAGVGLVYGGARVGLMGVVADAALAAGGEVIGVMPQALVDREIAHLGLTRLDVVGSMHERKARMAELASAFVALPGGAGTLEELFEAWTWGQLDLHDKPTALLDVDGFYGPLVEQLRVMTTTGYLDRRYIDALGVVQDAAGLLEFIDGYRHPGSKWVDAQPALTSVGWVHVRDGRLLAVRSRGMDRFYLPGGKPEPGECNEQALVREVREELGLDLSQVRPAFTVRAPAHGLACDTDLTMHCFFAVAVGEPCAAGEVEELVWLDPNDQSQAAPAVRIVLDQIAKSVQLFMS